MRFCCPHCDHPYYGTSEQGHVEPREFACVKCGQRVNIDDMVLHCVCDFTNVQKQQLLEAVVRPFVDKEYAETSRKDSVTFYMVPDPSFLLILLIFSV